MPTILGTSLVAADDLRQRRMRDAARQRDASQARSLYRSRNAQPRGEPDGCPVPPRPLRRWLALP